MTRVDWHTYFMNIARQAATRSTCDRKHVGAVIVRDKTILSTGYNGSIRGMPHCDDIGHMIENDHCVATVHAEANAIIQAAKNGVRIDGLNNGVLGGALPAALLYSLPGTGGSCPTALHAVLDLAGQPDQDVNGSGLDNFNTSGGSFLCSFLRMLLLRSVLCSVLRSILCSVLSSFLGI